MRIKRTVASRRWASSVAAFVAFAALCAVLAYWALQLFAPPVRVAPAGSLVDYRSAPDLGAAATLFGRASDAPSRADPGSSDIRVLGVAASDARGSAVLAIDSGGAKAYMIGDRVGDDLRLVAVRSDAVVLERNGARFELPTPQRPSVALLSSGPSAANGATASAEPPADARSQARSPHTAAQAPRSAGDAPRTAAQTSREAAGERARSTQPSPVQAGSDAAAPAGVRAGSGRAAGVPVDTARSRSEAR